MQLVRKRNFTGTKRARMLGSASNDLFHYLTAPLEEIVTVNEYASSNPFFTGENIGPSKFDGGSEAEQESMKEFFPAMSTVKESVSEAGQYL